MVVLMKILDNGVFLSKSDIDNLCKNCGSCCRNLTLQDKIELVIFFGHAEKFLTDVCPYSSGNGCTTYDFRPQVCQEWQCGVVDILRNKLGEACE